MSEEKTNENVNKSDKIQEYINTLMDTEFADSESYVIKLENFEGPLDLLLFLIKRAKIDIKDIFLSNITEQYLQFMDQVDNLDMDKAADFIEIAACLIEIKSKSLLPKPPVIVEEEDDPEKVLIQRLEEYKLYKEASQKMKENETIGLHYRAPDDSVGKPRLVLSDMTMDGLVNALQKMFLKLEQKAIENKHKNIVKDRFTVGEKISQIMEYFSVRDKSTFYDLFEEDYTKSEIITTFQSMLELLKDQFIRAEQNGLFEEIILYKV